jgi:hypothetical protein
MSWRRTLAGFGLIIAFWIIIGATLTPYARSRSVRRRLGDRLRLGRGTLSVSAAGRRDRGLLLFVPLLGAGIGAGIGALPGSMRTWTLTTTSSTA